ncbi:MAG TPA: ABC transporter permease [Terriglobia bacterium]|nr:ABC transporter permease [Terriglobia bacterium]
MGNWLVDILHDLRYAVRMLRRNPGFTATAVAALALGIGATTAIFSVVNTVLLQPLPYPQPDGLVQLTLHQSNANNYQTSLAVPEFMAMRGATHTLEDFCLYDFGGPGINLTGGDRPEQLKGIHVSANYFPLFGAPMAVGRPFTQEEDRPGGPRLVVISYGLWRSHFGGDRSIVGRTIQLGGEPYEVTGVLGQSFQPDPAADVWLPLDANPNSIDEAHYLLGAARLKPGVSLARANAELKIETEAFKRKLSDFQRLMGNNTTFYARRLQDAETGGNLRTLLFVLLGAVGFVLLIACANVANLLLARATIRKREIAIRAAVGAGRSRIIRQLLTESVLLALAGGAAGLVLGFAGVRALLAINPGNIPRIGDQGSAVSLDWRVLAFTIAVSLVTGVLFGLIPALNASRSDLNATLKESGARAGTGLRQNKSRSILVIVETALALVLLVGAFLLIRTFVAMQAVDPGINPHHVLTMQMSLAGQRFEKTSSVAQMEHNAEERLDAIPGVEAASADCYLPASGFSYDLTFNILGRAPSGKNPFTGDANWAFVSPQFFKVFEIPLIRGRLFTDLDTAAAPHVVIINQALAKQFWKKGNPVGQQMQIGIGIGPEFIEAPRQIIGIVGDVRDNGLNRNPPPIMYVPSAQLNDGVMALANRLSPIYWTVRTQVPPFSLSRQVEQQLRVSSGGLPVAHIRSMDEVMGESLARTDFNMVLFSIFAAIALLLAAIGIYGLIAYSVQQRTQEIGIRMALGAGPRDVRNMVVRQGMTLAIIGVAAGIAIAFAVTRLMASMLYGIKARDPLVFVSVAVLLSLIALLATYLPARRAAKVDPMIALRYE